MIRLVPEDDEVLHTEAEQVSNIDGDIAALIKKMSKVTKRERGYALAAPQVGVSLRIFTCLPRFLNEVLINPEIIEYSDHKVLMEEGCLSIPGYRVEVLRPESIHLKAIDLTGSEIDIEAEGLFARVIQHELDHLDGKLIR